MNIPLLHHHIILSWPDTVFLYLLLSVTLYRWRLYIYRHQARWNIKSSQSIIKPALIGFETSRIKYAPPSFSPLTLRSTSFTHPTAAHFPFPPPPSSSPRSWWPATSSLASPGNAAGTAWCPAGGSQPAWAGQWAWWPRCPPAGPGRAGSPPPAKGQGSVPASCPTRPPPLL